MLKGLGEAQQVYRVVNASGAQGRLDVSVTKGLTPLVGRESEATLLFERWAQVKGGQGQVVLLSGEAGIGKSRLLQVMKDHVAGEAHTLLECRSSPYYQNTALYPVTDMLPRVFNWQHSDTLEVKLGKVEQTLRHQRLALDEAIPLFANLLALSLSEDRYPPLTLSPPQQRQKTLQTIVTMLLAQAEQRPVLFILEDLHWTDPSTLELLELLIEQTPAAPICALLTCRPTFQPPWSHRSYLAQMTLNRLFRRQIEHMVERVAGGKGLPADVLQQIVEKTDGVPLYVEEMTKAVLDAGYLTEVDGHYALTGSFASLAIPATLQDSLMARLDQLGDAKAVAQYAAVIGRQFSYDLLLALSQLDEVMLQHELGRLVDAELLYQRGLTPQATYTFKHALIQDAAYQSLLKSTRQQYHRRIAQVLEERFAETVETQPELLAHHYTEAGEDETAIRYWQQAGQQASLRSAYAEAMSHLNKGLELVETLPDTAVRLRQEVTLQVSLGVALVATKGVASPEVEKAYLRARQICQQLGEPSPLFQVLQGLGGVYVLRAELQKASELAAQLLALAQRDRDPALLLEAYHLQWCLFYLGELRATQACIEQGLALYDSQKHRSQALQHYGHDPGVCCLAHKAYTEWTLGYPEQALQSIDEMLQLARELSHPQSLALSLAWAARLYQLCRQPLNGQAQAEAAVSLSTVQGFARPLAEGTFMKGWALAEQGQRAAGMAQMRQGLDGYRATAAQL
jgi:predicted ATPase